MIVPSGNIFSTCGVHAAKRGGLSTKQKLLELEGASYAF
jgi:hypothetical protein